MTKMITSIFLFLLYNYNVSAQGITEKILIDSTMEKQTLSSKGRNKFFSGVDSGQHSIKVSFDSIGWFPQLKKLYISGITCDKITNETLPFVTVSISRIESSDCLYSFTPTVSVVTDSLGSFKLTGIVQPKDKLIFYEIGYFVTLFHLDWLLLNAR